MLPHLICVLFVDLEHLTGLIKLAAVTDPVLRYEHHTAHLPYQAMTFNRPTESMRSKLGSTISEAKVLMFTGWF